jgi:16S rRNA (cytidine1402-2'-O)-methyltransferase
MPGTLFVVATPIGNLEDITARALRVLREVAIIAAEDTRRTARLLARYAITTPTTSLHEHNEAQKSAELIARIERGDSIALVSDAGTPTVSDPGQRLVREAIAAGVRVEPVPGASAALAALSVSGLPGDTFTFLGFPPTRSTDRKRWFERLLNVGGTVVFFEAPHRIHETLRQLARVAPESSVAIARELTKAHEELVRGPINEIVSKLPVNRGEFTIVANIGRPTENMGEIPVSDESIVAYFGEITKNRQCSRKQAINLTARRHQLSPNQVYAAIERAKKSGE